MPEETANKKLEVYLSEPELELIRRASEISGRSLSNFGRVQLVRFAQAALSGSF